MELRKLRLSGDNCDQMTMTATGVTESVTPITVAVTITSRCRNTSHSYRRNHHITAQPSRQTTENRHSRHLRMGLSQPNHLRKLSTTNVDFHSQPSQNSKPANPKCGLSQPIGVVSGGRIELLQG